MSLNTTSQHLEVKMFTRILRGRGNAGQGRGQGRGGGAGTGQGRGQGGGNKPGSGPGGNCVCPKCGKKVPHVAGQRCLDQVCPDCGTRMVRE
jgi:hypothetical protein